MDKKKIIIAVVLAVIALLLWLLPKYVFKAPTTDNQQQQNTETQKTTDANAFPISDIEATTLTEQSKKEYDFAVGKAQEWRPDSALVAVVVEYKDEINPKNGKNSYVFLSPSLPQYYFTLSVDQAKNEAGENSYTRVLNFKDDYLLPQDVVVAPIKYWKLSYLEALKKADSLGGNDIRKDNKKYDTTVIMMAQEGGYLHWETEYSVNDNVLFSASINAYTGEVM